MEGDDRSQTAGACRGSAGGRERPRLRIRAARMDVHEVSPPRVREERAGKSGVVAGRQHSLGRKLPFADVEYRALASVIAHGGADDVDVDGHAAVGRGKVSYEQYFRLGGRHGGARGSCAAADCPASGRHRTAPIERLS